jgi:hypothetical protein
MPRRPQRAGRGNRRRHGRYTQLARTESRRPEAAFEAHATRDVHEASPATRQAAIAKTNAWWRPERNGSAIRCGKKRWPLSAAALAGERCPSAWGPMSSFAGRNRDAAGDSPTSWLTPVQPTPALARSTPRSATKKNQPGEGPLDNPALAAQRGAVLGLTFGDQRPDPSLPDQPAILVVVVAAVSEQRVRSSPRPAESASSRRSAATSRSPRALRIEERELDAGGAELGVVRSRVRGGPPSCRSAPCYRCSTGLAGTARGRRRRR